MFKINSASSQLLLATVRITGKRKDGTVSIGTGFFFSFKTEKMDIPVLVTNKHVVEGCPEGEFLLHEASADPQIVTSASFPVNIQPFEANWVNHPDGVDLCAMPVATIFRAARDEGKKDVLYRTLSEEQLPNEAKMAALTALEEVTMIGYPIGLWDSANNLPLFRRGITASHPAVNFNGKPEGLVDIASFPGSSGSPIVILNEGSYFASGGVVFGSRFFLLGVLYGGPTYAADGTIKVVQIPTAQMPRVAVSIPIHLGAYIKSSELLSIKNELVKRLSR